MRGSSASQVTKFDDLDFVLYGWQHSWRTIRHNSFFSFSSLDCPSYNHTSWNCRTVPVNIKFSYFIIDCSIIDIARWRFVEWVTFTWSIVTVSCKKCKPSSNRTCKLSPTCFRTLLANLHLYVYIYGERAKALSIVMCEKVWCYKISANIIGCSTFCLREPMVYLGSCVLLL